MKRKVFFFSRNFFCATCLKDFFKILEKQDIEMEMLNEKN